MTATELDTIEVRNARLYELWNACHHAGSRWRSDTTDVRDLMAHLNEHFPGADVAALAAEVRWLNARIVELTSVQVPPSVPGERGRRTRSDVLELRGKHGIHGGCCERYADHSPCDCLENAEEG